MKIHIIVLSIILFTISIKADHVSVNMLNPEVKVITVNLRQEGIDLTIADYGSNRLNTVMHTDRNWNMYKFMKIGVRPIRIIIRNEANKSVSISAKSVGLPLIDSKKVSDGLRGYPILETLGLGMLNTLLIGACCLPLDITYNEIKRRPIFPGNFGFIKNLPLTTAGSVISLLSLGYYFYKANMRDNKIEDACKNIALENNIIIQPGEVLNKILFIDINSWVSVFNFKVFDAEGLDVVQIFQVNLT